MPGRILQPINPRDPESIRRHADTVQGFFDDPIAKVRMTLAPSTVSGSGFKRRLKLEVVDRLEGNYPPRSFIKDGKLDARWFVWWFLASARFDEPLSIAPDYITGRRIGSVGNTLIGQTDLKGVIEVDIVREAGPVWVHAGMATLMRAKGEEWQDGTPIDAVDELPSGAENVFPATSGPHEVCFIVRGSQVVQAYAESTGSYSAVYLGKLPSGVTITQTKITINQNATQPGPGATFSAGLQLCVGDKSTYLATGTPTAVAGVTAGLITDADGSGIHDPGTDTDAGTTVTLAAAVGPVVSPNLDVYVGLTFGGGRSVKSMEGGEARVCISYTVP